MKKYIIGLFSAICLMGAGCTEFEDFTPVDMGEGPAVTVTAEKTAVDAFKVTITPAEGTVYYSYIVTDEAMTVDPDQLLQAKYEGSTLVKAAERRTQCRFDFQRDRCSRKRCYHLRCDEG